MRYFAVILLAACGGASSSPSVTVMSATPDTLAPADDTMDDLTISVKYTDGDGDLGLGTAEVTDCRGEALVTTLQIPAIAPSSIDGHDEISGTMDLHVNDVGAVTAAALPQVCADLGVAGIDDTHTVFCVALIDEAGHRGGGDCTGTITLE